MGWKTPKNEEVNGYKIVEVDGPIFKVFEGDRQLGDDSAYSGEAAAHANSLPRQGPRHPYGGRSDIPGKLEHPVVHVAYSDPKAYADWAGMELPSEAEWELAARGGLEDAEFAWGDELNPEGKLMANTWQGTFPTISTKAAGADRTSPVGSFPANGYGIHDMIDNVWEWTSDYWSTRHPEPAAKSCCIPKNPRRGDREASFDPREPEIRIPRRVLNGGSHLCAPNYWRLPSSA